VKVRLLKPNSTLVADSKELIFQDGVCQIKKVTDDIQFFLDNSYLELIKTEEK